MADANVAELKLKRGADGRYNVEFKIEGDLKTYVAFSAPDVCGAMAKATMFLENKLTDQVSKR